jgi:hypothetical protein
MSGPTNDADGAPLVDDDLQPAVGRADADAVRSGAVSEGPIEALKDAGRAVLGDERKRDDDGAPVGQADHAADVEASGADPERI